MHYNKPHISVAQQMRLLRSRGMIISDEDLASNVLTHVNYYRLRAYWYPFEKDHVTHQFQENVNFSEIIKLYDFDQNLRLLLLDAIQNIEVSLRTNWAYHFSKSLGPFAYLEPQHNRNSDWLQNNTESLKVETKRSREPFINHYQTKYAASTDLPIWMACEVMSFGLFSRWYTSLKPTPVRKAIADIYGLNKNALPKIVHHLVLVRNLCAHHSRIWNRRLTVTMPRTSSHTSVVANSINSTKPRKLYNSMVIASYLENVINPISDWNSRLITLIETSDIDSGAMGFPANWNTLPVWNQ